MGLWDTIKQIQDTCCWSPEEKGAERMAENFLSLMKYININIQTMVHVR